MQEDHGEKEKRMEREFAERQHEMQKTFDRQKQNDFYEKQN
jgi:hypothetical protein